MNLVNFAAQFRDLGLDQIQCVFEEHKGRYGSPRITRALREQGLRCGKNRVARLMRNHKLMARRKRAFRPQTTLAGKTVAPNLIRGLEVSAPDQIWVSDITYVATLEGWLYLAVILDLFSRKVVVEAGRNSGGRTGSAGIEKRSEPAPARSGALLPFRSGQPV